MDLAKTCDDRDRILFSYIFKTFPIENEKGRRLKTFSSHSTRCDSPDTLSCTLSLSAVTVPMARRRRLTTRWLPTRPTGSPTFTLILPVRAFSTFLDPPPGPQMTRAHISFSLLCHALESPEPASCPVGRPPITAARSYLAPISAHRPPSASTASPTWTHFC